MRCAGCRNKIPRSYDIIRGSSLNYSRLFHLECARVTVELFHQLLQDGRMSTWTCRLCSGLPDIREGLAVKGRLDQMDPMMNANFHEVETSIEMVCRNQEFLSAKWDELTKAVEEIENLRKKIEKLERKVQEYDKGIHYVSERVNQLEQYGNIYMEIRGKEVEVESVETTV